MTFQAAKTIPSQNNPTDLKTDLFPVEKQEIIELKNQANRWKSLFERNQKKVEELEKIIQKKDGIIKKLQQRLFGKKSEKKKKPDHKTDNEKSDQNNEKKGRGQQRGSKGHGRTGNNGLPIKEEIIEANKEDLCCKNCGKEYCEINSTEDSEVIEVEIKAHNRKIRRKKYKNCCSCKNVPEIITATAPSVKPIPKGKYGVSFWTSIFLSKFLWQIPINRHLKQWESEGLKVSPGSVADGLKFLKPFFDPVVAAITERNLKAHHWHADESRWMVFVNIEGKKNQKHWLWVIRSDQTVVFLIKESRGTKVIEDHFGSVAYGVISADRYAAYTCLMNTTGRFVIAFCWAHVRRDFLEEAAAWKGTIFEEWALDWVTRIATLYHLNKERLLFDSESDAFSIANAKLCEAMALLKETYLDQLKNLDLPESCQKVLISLNNHWSGLILFMYYWWIPMDNNLGENAIRNPVVGRKGYYGSGSVWSAELTAFMFTIYATLSLWKINQKKWTTNFLTECASLGGKPPTNIDAYLPWKMTDEQLLSYGADPENKPKTKPALSNDLIKLKNGWNQKGKLFNKPNKKSLEMKEPLASFKAKKLKAGP
ncbi:MAG: IS66 family transposase [Nitrospinae bacterium]|nr:IS66 family transposase [Nitrospinota bacterium]